MDSNPSQPGATLTTPRTASGLGLATFAADGTVLDVWFPAPALGPAADVDSSMTGALESVARPDADRGTTQRVVTVESDLDSAPVDTLDSWLRLHLLSHRLAAPNTLNLDGIF
ncbi:MAG TPA: 2,3,4,5-tetrahydropyridine-2,6-dicarboxylate N-succinyltransferase, partial [Citricoccus sp.]|nr:2,3,4,5-tetrahydropyridine-2,6-dicarboxylate N-succinyltransferase [Citricoccus sp.]